jgi:phosphoribosylaminoimidazole-succinocarboxamide synthase
MVRKIKSNLKNIIRERKMTDIVTKTDISDKLLLNRGKVRDIYDAGEYLLIVTTDRISAFDVVMNEGIPYKGIVLNQLSLFWFRKTEKIIKNHLVTDLPQDYPDPFNQYPEILKGRSMLVKKANPFPIECIVRGYLAGSGWKEYQKLGSMHGVKLPQGLENSSKLKKSLFTPSTKAESGHDININLKQMEDLVGKESSKRLKEASLKLYSVGADYAQKKGIIIADTKFEFGILNGEIILIDEVMTPDSSRFWPADLYTPGKNQMSLDKQYVRDYLEGLDWNKMPPPPSLPKKIIENTSKKYQEIMHILIGKSVHNI